MRKSANKKPCGSSDEIQQLPLPLSGEKFLEFNVHAMTGKFGGAPASDDKNIAFHRQFGTMTPKILADRALDPISRHRISDFAANRDS
jgi:hypothetical protein